MRRLACALAVFCAVAAASAAFAQQGVPSHIQRYLSDSGQASTGKLRWFGFHVYDAHLYVPPQFDSSNHLEKPFVLELTYARKLYGKAIAETTREEIERLSFGDDAQRKRWHDALLRIFPDVDKGSRIAGVNQPGSGVRFYVNGKFAEAINEPEFARAFFAIWLDERTRAPQLRDALLKKK